MAKRHSGSKEAVSEDLLIPLGHVIKAWREVRGLSVTSLAERAGVTKGYISHLEHDRILHPKREFLGKLASALGVTELDLLSHRMPPHGTRAVSKPRDRSAEASERESHITITEEQLEEIKRELRELGQITLERLSHIEAVLAKVNKKGD